MRWLSGAAATGGFGSLLAFTESESRWDADMIQDDTIRPPHRRTLPVRWAGKVSKNSAFLQYRPVRRPRSFCVPQEMLKKPRRR